MQVPYSIKSLFLTLFLINCACATPLEDFKKALDALNQCADEFEQCIDPRTSLQFDFHEVMFKLIACVQRTKVIWDGMSKDDKNNDEADFAVDNVSKRLFQSLNDAFWLEKVSLENRKEFTKWFEQLLALMREFFSRDTQEKLRAFDSLFNNRDFDRALLLGPDIIFYAGYNSDYPSAERTLVKNWVEMCMRDTTRCKLESQITQSLELLQSFCDASASIAETDHPKIIKICQTLEDCLTQYRNNKGNPQTLENFNSVFQRTKELLQERGFFLWADCV